MKQAEIIQGCKKGERNAQKAFVMTYSGFILNICLRYTYDQHEAKDCLQETLVHVLKKIDQYNEFGSFNSWLSRVTVNKTLEYLRKFRKLKILDLSGESKLRIDESIHLKIEEETVVNYMSTLPEKYKIVLNMYIVEGYKHKEIAELLGVTESTSRSILTRARKMLEKTFCDGEENEPERKSQMIFLKNK